MDCVRRDGLGNHRVKLNPGNMTVRLTGNCDIRSDWVYFRGKCFLCRATYAAQPMSAMHPHCKMCVCCPQQLHNNIQGNMNYSLQFASSHRTPPQWNPQCANSQTLPLNGANLQGRLESWIQIRIQGRQTAWDLAINRQTATETIKKTMHRPLGHDPSWQNTATAKWVPLNVANPDLEIQVI